MSKSVTNEAAVTSPAQVTMLSPSNVPRDDSKLRRAGRQIVAGGIAVTHAGLTEICLMHPLDVIKTRFQVQKGIDDPNRYKSYMHCVRKMIRNEGPLSFYKGIIPPLLAETPKRATKFFTFEQYRSLLSQDDGNITPIGLILAGAGSGLTEGLFITPFERVKVSLQIQHARMAESPSTWVHAHTIIKEDGLGLTGLFRGLGATLWRHGLWNTVYFGFYHNLKPVVLHSENPSVASRLFLGFLAGSLASIANIPFDVAKSRIQGTRPSMQPLKYLSTIQTIRVVLKEEGFFALYKGLLPKLMRLGPGGGIMLVVYEQVSNFLRNKGF